jgi:hypothetical protein
MSRAIKRKFYDLTTQPEYKGSKIPVQEDPDDECESKSERFNNSRKVFLENLKKLELQVYEKYQGTHQILPAECKNGHFLWIKPKSFHQNTNVCYQCHIAERSSEFYEDVARMGGVALEDYTFAIKKVKIRCIECKNELFISPAQLKYLDNLCPHCAGVSSMQARQKFEKQLASIGAIQIGRYITGTERVHCKCSNGHDWYPLPVTVRNGGGCKICIAEQFRKVVEEMGGKVTGKFTGVTKPVEITCGKGHVEIVTPALITNGYTKLCRACSGWDPQINEQKFRDKIASFGGRVTGKYVNTTVRVECICPKGHKCEPKPLYCLTYGGYMCRKCHRSRGETRLDEILKQLKYDTKEQFSFDIKHEKTKRYRRYDFKISPDILIEYDGLQHFTLWKQGDQKESDDAFEYRRQRDYEKTKLALEQKHKIIRIHFSWLTMKPETQIRLLQDAIKNPAPFITISSRSDQHEYDWLAALKPTQLFNS